MEAKGADENEFSIDRRTTSMADWRFADVHARVELAKSAGITVDFDFGTVDDAYEEVALWIGYPNGKTHRMGVRWFISDRESGQKYRTRCLEALNARLLQDGIQ